MQQELSEERSYRYNAKLGYGGVVDIEFIIQFLQMKFGSNRNIRSRNTLEALAKLEENNCIDSNHAEALRDSYIFFGM